MIVRTFTDPGNPNRRIQLHIGAEAAGIPHDDCDQLAEVHAELDVAYCAECGFQCRISGAWYTELLEDVIAATRDAIAGATPADLEDLWKEERDRATSVMADDPGNPTGTPLAEDDPAIRAALAAVSELVGTVRTDPAGMAYIIGAVDAARAQANWVPWWLQPVVRTEPSDEYYEGVRDGIRAHATISGGQLLVGALRRPIDKVLAEVDAYQAQRRYWKFG